MRSRPTSREGRGRGVALYEVNGVGAKHEAAIICGAPVHVCAAACVPGSQHPLLVAVIYHPGCRQTGKESADYTATGILHPPCMLEEPSGQRFSLFASVYHPVCRQRGQESAESSASLGRPSTLQTYVPYAASTLWQASVARLGAAPPLDMPWDASQALPRSRRTAAKQPTMITLAGHCPTKSGHRPAFSPTCHRYGQNAWLQG